MFTLGDFSAEFARKRGKDKKPRKRRMILGRRFTASEKRQLREAKERGERAGKTARLPLTGAALGAGVGGAAAIGRAAKAVNSLAEPGQLNRILRTKEGRSVYGQAVGRISGILSKRYVPIGLATGAAIGAGVGVARRQRRRKL